MTFAIINKKISASTVQPNMSDNSENWELPSDKQADGFPDGTINIAYEAVDRHLIRGLGDKTAIRWHSKKGEQRNISYAQLAEQTSRFASVLHRLGVEPGDRVFGLAGRVPELYTALLGTLKYGAVFSPLFSAFGPDPIRSRMQIGGASVLITTERLYKKKILPWKDRLDSLQHILLLNVKSETPEGCHNLADLMQQADPLFPTAHTDPEDMALLHFTSGTTGTPKGAVHVHQAVEHHIYSSYFALDLHPDDIYWCTADPGWVTGTSYGVIAPLCHGVTMVVDEAEFDPLRWYQLLQDESVTVWYTAPTAVRMLMKAGDDLPAQYDLSKLRFMASVGEPLNPEAVVWGDRVLGLPFHDNWWQSETGGIIVANYASQPIKPGSMGRPLPNVKVALVRRLPDGNIEVQPHSVASGELAIQAGWASMFRGYLDQDERYQSCFIDGWYLSGDLACRDQDGYYWFIGRDDDVIKTSGHLIGPFEVESVLVEHPAVAEAAVIGIPDPVASERIKAFVSLHKGYTPDDALRKTLLGHARKNLGAAVAPKEIEFKANLPKTRSGKIMRRLLRARELGLPEGDISTLESDEK